MKPYTELIDREKYDRGYVNGQKDRDHGLSNFGPLMEPGAYRDGYNAAYES